MSTMIPPLGARWVAKGAAIVWLLSCFVLFLPNPSWAQQDGVTSDAAPSFYASDLDCRKVFGYFRAESLLPEECASPFGICSRGQLYGRLKATYEMTVDLLVPTQNPDIPFVSFFEGESAITLRNGDVLVGIDTGSLDASPPGAPGSGKFSTLLSFTDGTLGYLYIHGTTDFISGSTRGYYAGLVCSE